MREQITEYQHWTSCSAEVSEYFVTHFYQCINMTRNHLTLCTCNEYFFVHRRQKGIIGNIKLHWHETQVAYQHTWATTCKWRILQKSYFRKKLLLLYFSVGHFLQKKKNCMKSRLICQHTLQAAEKKGLWHMSCYFSKRERDKSL